MSERANDVVVVGSRCAGAATAMLLARRGLRVTVVERTRTPADTLSTHGIARGGVVQLARWGLLDAVLASGAPPIRQVVFNVDGDETVRTIRDHAGVDHLIAPRRYLLDEILAGAAREAGATIRTGVTATEALRGGDGRVAGVRTSGGDIPARLTVGADGVRSRIANLVGSEIVESFPADAATFYVYVAALENRGFEYHVGRGAFAGVFPTHDGESCVWVCGPTSIAPQATTGFADLLAQVSPSLAARVRQGHVTSRVRGAARLPNHRRRATGPGWALVGDAGYHRDPITGHGMTDAFRDAELLARNLDNLPEYERLRDAAAAEVFAITRDMTRFPEPARFTELQRRLGRVLDEEATMLAALPQKEALPQGELV
ncbi:NAD(P)/FAD-dependent oxidoreductase [Actinoplanes sp. NBRC 103695]|uniref:NAD(P)/FAD-dependent oxidoreductase n=1 Tax=Actinoplanes sp. NBRC 103695 TaxID=3032202 RepID=UPI0024A2D693|nr:NAD(P)/FAD-dependent oxidoreductase [Actinoplanes sp. NBRC 103695]GLY96183.1 FAD-dependent oxidoreductase [Actinoplanes sp. NBRC 103695]